MSKAPLVVLLAASLLFVACNNALAYTVTLNGGCQTGVINQTRNYIILNISNTGDGPAQSLLLTPMIYGAQSLNGSASITQLLPSATNSTKFYLQNFSTPGSYFEYFRVGYQQSGDMFTTIFPCYAYLFQRTQSLAVIRNITIDNTKDGYVLNASLENTAQYPINAILMVAAPPAFAVNYSSRSIYLSPDSALNYDISFSPPTGFNASYPLSLALSYTYNNLHYAYYLTKIVRISSKSIGNGNSLLLWVIAAIIGALIVLICYSIIRQRIRRTTGGT